MFPFGCLSSGKMQFGTQYLGSPDNFAIGIIDELLIFEDYLSSEDMSKIYNMYEY